MTKNYLILSKKIIKLNQKIRDLKNSVDKGIKNIDLASQLKMYKATYKFSDIFNKSINTFVEYIPSSSEKILVMNPNSVYISSEYSEYIYHFTKIFNRLEKLAIKLNQYIVSIDDAIIIPKLKIFKSFLFSDIDYKKLDVEITTSKYGKVYRDMSGNPILVLYCNCNEKMMDPTPEDRQDIISSISKSDSNQITEMESIFLENTDMEIIKIESIESILLNELVLSSIAYIR